MRIGLEVAPCGGLDPVGLAPVEDGVEVHLEDLVLAVLTVQFDRQDGFLQLALDIGRRVRADVDLFDQLLTDGAAALLNAVVLIVRDRRPHDPADIDPTVGVEGPILGGEGGLGDPRRDVVERHDDPVIALLADVGQQGPVAVVDQGVLVHLVRGQATHGRQRTHGLRGDRGDAHQRHQQHHDQPEDDRAPEVGAGTLAPPVDVSVGAPAGR